MLILYNSWDNHIAVIEALVPNKTDALTYLDSDAALPTRYARVIINRGAAEVAGLDDYMVGPLPASQDTTITPMSWAYNSHRHTVDNPLPDYEAVVEWFATLGKEAADMVEDLLGDVVNPGDVKIAPALMAVSRPAAFENGTISSWARIHSPGLRFDAWSLLAQGLFCRFDITGRDSSKWTINEWYYGGVLYNSTAAFRKAWKAGEVKKMPTNRDGAWSDAAPDEEGEPGRDLLAPVMIQPDGPRYKLDEKERHVSWLGWSFYVNSLQAIGLGLWDVKFGGERILYELGLQEAMAHYAGEDPLSVGMNWLDTLFGMGLNSYELVPGYDCPAYATYLPMTFHHGEKTITRKNSLCIFEWTASETLQVRASLRQSLHARNTNTISVILPIPT
jgi:primary-amine oxidase